MKHRVLIEAFVIVALLATGCRSATETPVARVQNPSPNIACTVPDLIGLDADIAMDMILGLGLQPNKSVQHDTTVPEGAVISQHPPSGTVLEPCEGQVDVAISLGPLPRPAGTPIPTATPGQPTPTPTSTPLPPTATPDPRLFWDDFEGLLKPEWGFSGQSYSLTNGMLMLSDGSVESKIIGSKDWIDYRIILREIKPEFRVQMHAQDRDNYLEFRCGCSHSAAWGGEIQCRWLKVIDARSAEVPGATYNSGRKRHDACAPIGLLVLEHQEGVYRTFINGEQQIRFVDETFENGGFRLQGFGNMQLGSIEAHAMGATYGD